MNYNQLKINNVDKSEENAILEKVFKCIDEKRSFLYDTGAGSGKTYALKEALVYAISKYGREYDVYGQKIICITYTNVAVNEIKERLGNTKLVQVSTIHERIWDIIKRFKKELLEIHKEKLSSEIQLSEDFIENNKDAEWYRTGIKDKDKFIKSVKDNYKDYRAFYNKSSSEFKEGFVLKYFSGLIVKNVSNFKTTVNKLISIERNKRAIEDIENRQVKKVEYTPNINHDILYKFKFSHDTLLDYAENLIIKYSELQNLILDKYPIILVDEYQDTSEKIFNFINLIRKKALELNKPVCVGFFGDSKQSIYDNGIDYSKFDGDYQRIKNTFNRRSSKEIVKIANEIRNDDIKQRTIYQDFFVDNCKFYNEFLTDESVETIKQEWGITVDNKLHCFLLKNETVAEKNLFKSVYEAFEKCYKGVRHEQLSTELLSNDESKLGEIELIFKKLIRFKVNLANKNSLVNNLMDLKKSNYNINDIDRMLKKLSGISGNNLLDFLTSFFEELKDELEIVHYIIGDEINDLDSFKFKIISVLFNDEENPDLNIFLNLTIEELSNWYQYISNDFLNKDVVYQTLHSTKGLQYDNVIVELNDNFAKDKIFYKRFFLNCYDNTNIEGTELIKFKRAQNLVYVGVTRAIKNLAVFYKYDNEDAILSKNINKIFRDIFLVN